MMGSTKQNIEPLLFVFHGTPPVNVSSVLKQGMRPEQTPSRGHWFARCPETSIPYCKVLNPPSTLILFLILPEPLAVLYDDSHDVIVLSDSHFALPLGTVDGYSFVSWFV